MLIQMKCHLRFTVPELEPILALPPAVATVEVPLTTNEISGADPIIAHELRPQIGSSYVKLTYTNLCCVVLPMYYQKTW